MSRSATSACCWPMSAGRPAGNYRSELTQVSTGLVSLRQQAEDDATKVISAPNAQAREPDLRSLHGSDRRTSRCRPTFRCDDQRRRAPQWSRTAQRDRAPERHRIRRRHQGRARGDHARPGHGAAGAAARRPSGPRRRRPARAGRRTVRTGDRRCARRARPQEGRHPAPDRGDESAERQPGDVAQDPARRRSTCCGSRRRTRPAIVVAAGAQPDLRPRRTTSATGSLSPSDRCCSRSPCCG